ncbi:sensor histidine kinase [Edaphobacter modestus]|uniref:histidine kinase n=1 Tax=Edaphobacter modestus TaxID=388466 RepID=A0A4Q7YXL4_9BACT|nr:ATP-binding protein [Edaphobacter modestus]RZU42607.1 histidine kinase/DNA gyrase B/HSP90-like ATPase [Edaphobacter modestus]
MIAGKTHWSAELAPPAATSTGVLSSSKGLLMGQSANSEIQPDLSVLFETLRLSEERALAGQLALEVMHEIRNPLEALSNLAYLTMLEADDPGKVREYMRLAEEQMFLVTRVASQTLGFARPTDKHQPVKLVSVAEAALRIHQRAMQTKRVRLITDLDAEATAPLHRGEILQVISNLIVNAVDALQTEGILYLRVKKSGKEVQLIISDNGHGIPREHSEKIFTPFFTTKQGRGSGLGLALSKRIIDRHRGTIRMRSSVLPGKSGTTFRISLPAITA